MTISWRQLETAEDVLRAWGDVGEICPHGTFFHTLEWAEVFCSAVREWAPDAVAIEFSDGNLGVLPMLRRADSEHRQSMAPFVYGGPLFLRAPTEEHLDEIGKVARWYDDIVLYDNPFSPYAWRQEGLVRWRIHTHVLELDVGFDAIHAGARRMIRHYSTSERAGVSVCVARSLDDVDAYYEVYLDALRRWDDPSTACYPRELFHRLFERQEAGRGVRLWIGDLEGRVVSGLVMLYRGPHCVAWHAATHSEHLQAGVSAAVYMVAIRAACEDALRWFDFNPSGHLRSVEFFKESFGARRLRFDMYHSPAFADESESGPKVVAALATRETGGDSD
jgi:hypothetical protein